MRRFHGSGTANGQQMSRNPGVLLFSLVFGSVATRRKRAEISSEWTNLNDLERIGKFCGSKPDRLVPDYTMPVVVDWNERRNQFSDQEPFRLTN